MRTHSASGGRAPSSKTFRPILVYTGPELPLESQETEILRLKAELARVKKELRELTLATREFVLSMI